MPILESLCPICSAPVGNCEHWLISWSKMADQYEPSPLVAAMERLDSVTLLLLVHALETRVSPKSDDMASLFRQMRGEDLDNFDPDDTIDPDDVRNALREEITQLNFQWLARLSYVIVTEEVEFRNRRGREITRLLLWSREPGNVEEAISLRAQHFGVEEASEPDDSEVEAMSMPTPDQLEDAKSLTFPKEERWLLDVMVAALADRLVQGHDDAEIRRGLIRWIWALQRLPIVEHKTTLVLAMRFMTIGSFAVTLDMEHFELALLEEGTTVVSLCYFIDSEHCMDLTRFLTGDERREKLEYVVRSMTEVVEDPNSEIWIEDYSTGDAIDRAPMSWGWS